MRIRIAAMTAAAIALAGCASTPAEEPRVATFYTCDNGPRLIVETLEDDRIRVQMGDDEPLILPLVKSASGAKYMTARHSFWDKGGEATWTVGRMAPMTCRKVSIPG